MRPNSRSSLGVAAAAAALAALTANGCQRGPAAPAPMPPPEVATLAVAPRSVALTTELPGRTAPYLIAEIRPQVSGLIQKRLFVEGSDVTAGQILYQIDPAPFQAALDNALAALGRAQAHLPAVRARAERFGKALADKAISQQDYDDAAAALKQAEAEVEYWKATAETARIQLGYARIAAPISGRIGRSSVTDGAIVTAYQPAPLAAIQQLDPIYVDVPQSTTELLRLRRRLEEGRADGYAGSALQKVRLILEDGTEYPWDGTLQFRDVTVDPTTGTVILRMVFPNPKGILLPGMFVRARIQEGVEDQAILVPEQAVSRDPKGDPFVFLVNDAGVVELRKLKVDRAIGSEWLVTAGLAPGERVIVEGLLRVRPGVPVREVRLDAGDTPSAPAGAAGPPGAAAAPAESASPAGAANEPAR